MLIPAGSKQPYLSGGFWLLRSCSKGSEETLFAVKRLLLLLSRMPHKLSLVAVMRTPIAGVTSTSIYAPLDKVIGLHKRNMD